MSFPGFLRPEADAYLREILDAEQYARFMKLAAGEGELSSIALDTPWSELPNIPKRAMTLFTNEGIATVLDAVIFGIDILKGGPTNVRNALMIMNMGQKLADQVLDALAERGWSRDDLGVVRQFYVRASKQSRT